MVLLVAIMYRGQESIVDTAGLERVFRALEIHSDDSFLHEVACALVANCLSSHTAREITLQSGLGVIVSALRSFPTNVALLENAVSCLGALAASVAGRSAVMAADGLGIVLGISDTYATLGSVQDKCCLLLRNLTASTANQALIVHGGGLVRVYRAMDAFLDNAALQVIVLLCPDLSCPVHTTTCFTRCFSFVPS